MWKNNSSLTMWLATTTVLFAALAGSAPGTAAAAEGSFEGCKDTASTTPVQQAECSGKATCPTGSCYVDVRLTATAAAGSMVVTATSNMDHRCGLSGPDATTLGHCSQVKRVTFNGGITINCQATAYGVSAAQITCYQE